MKFGEKAFWVLLSTVFAKGLMFVVHILSGRILGPEVYGEYNLIISVASFFILFSTLGFVTATRKVLPGSKQKRSVFSTAGSFILLWSIVFLGCVYFFKDLFWKYFSIPNYMVIAAIIFVMIDNFKDLTDSLLFSLDKIKVVSINNFVAHLFSFMIFVVLLCVGLRSYDVLLITYCCIGLFFIILSLPYIKKSLKKPDIKSLKLLGKTSKSIFVFTLATFFLGNIDKLMLNYFLGLSSVGVYAAYFTSCVMPMSVLLLAFNHLLFSHIAKNKSLFKKSYVKYKKVFKYSFGLIPLFCLSTSLFVWLYKFELKISLIVMFSVLAILLLLKEIGLVFVYNVNDNAIGKFSLVILIASFINIFFNYLLIPYFGILGAIIASVINEIITLLFILKFINRKI